jgi:hypothetical protein
LVNVYCSITERALFTLLPFFDPGYLYKAFAVKQQLCYGDSGYVRRLGTNNPIPTAVEGKIIISSSL